MLEKLLAHPVTHAFVADGDQLALSYLESIAVHKASSSSASASVAGASHKSSNGKGHQPKVETETVPAKNLDGGDGGLEGSGGGSWRGGELDDDDDVGFRVTCVSHPSNAPLLVQRDVLVNSFSFVQGPVWRKACR